MKRSCEVCGKPVTLYARVCREHYLEQQRAKGEFIPPPSTVDPNTPPKAPGECADCGKKVTKGSWRCHSCHIIFMNQSRQQRVPKTYSAKIQAENALLASLVRATVNQPVKEEE